MSRKDLSRTVIEGGRYFRNSFDRRASHGLARARTRVWLAAVRFTDDDDEEPELRGPPHVGRMFRDKLAVARRWLASRCGRPWSKVYAEIRERFETRTTAGRHLVFDHLLPMVWRGDVTRNEVDRERYFVVDRHGILRRGRWYRWRYSKARQALLAAATEASDG